MTEQTMIYIAIALAGFIAGMLYGIWATHWDGGYR